MVFMSLPTSLWSAETKVSLGPPKQLSHLVARRLRPLFGAQGRVAYLLAQWRRCRATPSLAWHLLPGVETGPIQWPLPEKEVVSGLTYSYHEEFFFWFPLQFDASLKPGQVNLQCQVNWLECQETCVPRQAKVLGTIEISLEEKASDEAPLIKGRQIWFQRSTTRYSSERIGPKRWLKMNAF